MAVSTLGMVRSKLKGRRLKPDLDNDMFWKRPIDWPQLPDVAAGDQKFVGSQKVEDHDSCYATIQIGVSTGTWTVDWGDGTVNSGNSTNAIVSHKYDYASFGGAVTTEGFKVAIVTVTTSGGNIILVNTTQKHASLGANNAWGTKWLEMRIAGAFSGSIGNMQISNSSLVTHKSLRSFEYVGTNGFTGFATSMFTGLNALENFKVPKSFTSGMTSLSSFFSGCSALKNCPDLDTSSCTIFTSMFSGCTRLRRVPLLDTSAGTNFSSMFNACPSLRDIPAFDTSAGTNFQSMFAGCSSLETIPLLDTHLGTSFASMFQNCANLKSVPALNTASSTGFGTMFQNCTSLRTIPLLNTSAGTTFANMFAGCSSLEIVPALDLSNSASGQLGMFGTCNSLSKSLVTGGKYSVNYPSQLSAAELNRIYTNLGTASAQTITVTGNAGVAGDDPTIATAKGWTVSGS